MAGSPLTGAESWNSVQRWLALPQVTLLPEPAGLDEFMGNWTSQHNLRGGTWTDAYLAAFAAASGARLVSFDRDFLIFPGIEFLHLHA